MAPEVDLSQLKDIDIKQSYCLLFEHASKDFLTKRDFEIIMAAATAPPPDFKVKIVPIYIVGDSLVGAYKAVAKGGDLFRGATLEAVKAATLGNV